MTVGSDNPFPSVLLVEGDPEALASNPSAGQRRLAVGTDHLLYLVDDAGTATLVGGPSIADILDLPTAETDDTLVLAPDGAGGVEFRAETAGGGDVATDAIWTTAGKVAVATGTATATEQWPPGHEFDYVEKTSSTSVTATTEATANTVVQGAAVTYDGSTTVEIQFFSPYSQPASGGHNIVFVLYGDGATLGLFGIHTGGASVERVPVSLRRRLTPSAASHTYSVRAYVDSGTGTVSGGAGGSGSYMPAFIRIVKV